MSDIRRKVRAWRPSDILAVGLILAVIGFAVSAKAAGLSAATYTKLQSIVVKPEGGGAPQYLVRFTITGGSGDTYTTGGVTPSATATGLGFNGFKWVNCNPQSVAWTAYPTTANAVVLRSTNVQLANSTSLQSVSLICDALAY